MEHEQRDALVHGAARGRASGVNPGNRFEAARLHILGEHADEVAAESPDGVQIKTQVYPDHSKTILNPVDSPDVPFNWTVNPYRGCEHGCVYCYARPTHETLGFSCGLDFETKIVAKHEAPRLLRHELARPGWKAETVVMSGVTDCYQPVEAKLEITRKCLEVFAECRNPVSIITKSRLVLRDVDLLVELAAHQAARVAISVTTLSAELAGRLEPRASSPRDRLATISRLRDAGVPVLAMIAPIIPGLTDSETPALLKAVADAGACTAGYVLLRLPYQVKDVFADWLTRHYPARAQRVLSLMADSRGGTLYSPEFGKRMRGEGPLAENISDTFHLFSQRHGLSKPLAPLSNRAFRRPVVNGQSYLFDV